MSAISLFPNEVMSEIFFYIPPSVTVTNCRLVCKNWNAASSELGLWQKIATSIDIEINPSATAQDIEVSVRNYLLRRFIVISTEGKLKERLKNYFSDLPDGVTKALCYRSSSHPEAIGFFIKTNNNKIARECCFRKYRNISACNALLVRLRGLTIIGKSNADYACKGVSSISPTNGPLCPLVFVKVHNLDKKLTIPEHFPF